MNTKTFFMLRTLSNSKFFQIRTDRFTQTYPNSSIIGLMNFLSILCESERINFNKIASAFDHMYFLRIYEFLPNGVNYSKSKTPLNAVQIRLILVNYPPPTEIARHYGQLLIRNIYLIKTFFSPMVFLWYFVFL